MKEKVLVALLRLQEDSLKPGIGCDFTTTVCKACWSESLEKAYRMGLRDGEEETHKEYRALEKRCTNLGSVKGFTA